jgi:SPP1 family predicted phage head-tail adaptor
MATAAAMRDFVSLLTLVAANDGRWGTATVGSWQQYAQVWASVLPVAGTKAGTEAFEAKDNGVQSSTNYLVTIRYRTDITAKDRILYRGNTLEILSCVDPDGLRRTLNIQATNYPGVT